MWGWRRETLQTLPFHFVKDNFFDESIFWKKLNPFYRSFASNSGWDIRSSYSQARNADTVGKKWKISLWFFWGATRKPKNSYKTVEEETWKYCLTQKILLIIIFFPKIMPALQNVFKFFVQKKIINKLGFLINNAFFYFRLIHK